MCVVFSKTPPLTNLSSLIAASPSQQLIWDSSPDNAMMVLTKKTTNDGDFCADFPPLRLKWKKGAGKGKKMKVSVFAGFILFKGWVGCLY